MTRLPYALPLIALLSACSLAPDYQRPTVTAADSWRAEITPPAADIHEDDPAWWGRFGSPALQTLVAQALANNTDLEASLQRVAQARAGLRIAGADRLPSIDASGSLSKDWSRPLQSGTTDTSGYRGGASLSYELDLWGRQSNSVKAARNRTDAARFSRDALALVIEAEVVEAYGQILALNDQFRITGTRLENAEEIYRIVDVRFREGSASGLELAQQGTELANFKASLASIEQRRSNAINQLAVLTGTAPQNFEIPDAALDSLTVPDVAVLPPSVLLTRRPDIRQSESQLIAANADIGVARAAWFPSLVIGGDAGVLANPVGGALSTAAGLAASVAAPIFDGGRISGNVERTKALRNELIANYRGVILTAFQESEDALAALRGTEKRLVAYGTAAEQARIAYRLSRDRFDAGSIDFITLLDAQRSLLQAEDNLVQARYDRIAAAVQLFKAMGGGWTETADVASGG